MKDFSYITNSHPEFIENLYRDFSKDPGSVDPEIKKFFEGFDFAISSGASNGNGKSISSTVPIQASPSAITNVDVDWMREI
jgi:2-oxoglutarate dehydrogenase E1 component